MQQEKAEAEDRITLKSLRSFADALDCDLVYAFVPRAASLQELVDARVRAAAKANVLGMKKLTSHTASSTFSPCNVDFIENQDGTERHEPSSFRIHTTATAPLDD